MKIPDATPIVLIVEDEMVLRMRAVDIVEDAGFVPIQAVNADEAIEVLESREDISLLFTDIQMPGSMDGLKLAHAVHTRWPHIKIILVSGQIAVTDADKPTDSRFFPKPLEIQKMIDELQQMIGKGALRVMPPLVAGDDFLTKENNELRLRLQQAGIDAKALLLKTLLDTEKQQLLIDENQPFKDAANHRERQPQACARTGRNRRQSNSSSKRASTLTNERLRTNYSTLSMQNSTTGLKICWQRSAQLRTRAYGPQPV